MSGITLMLTFRSFQSSTKSSIIFKVLLKLIVLESNQVFNIHNIVGLKILEKIMLGLSDLVDHKFRHKSQYCLVPISSCR